MSLENTADSAPEQQTAAPAPVNGANGVPNGLETDHPQTAAPPDLSAAPSVETVPQEPPGTHNVEPHDADTRPVDPPRGAIAEWAITILLLLFLTTTLVQAYVIPTGSMEDTLLIGDHLLVDKLAFAPSGPISKHLLPYTDVQRGDIIVFRYPVDIRQTFVKRCIGVPGDRIRVVNKEVYRNGVKLNEPYTYHKTDFIEPYRDNFPADPDVMVDRGAIDMLQNHTVNGEVVVPPNSYFAMGDNRDSSLDSRYWGFVPRENIIGKPLIIYWSYDAPSDQLQNPSIGLDHILDVGRNFFSKTRWRRTFQIVHPYRGN